MEKTMMNRNVLDYEPHLALFVPDDDPLIFYRHIAEFATKHLRTGGKLYLEINEALGNETAALLQARLPLHCSQGFFRQRPNDRGCKILNS
jgi:release factor glutamine methyltransferase